MTRDTISGRSGTDIASGLVAMLDSILKDNPEVTDFVLWSDSCVPQNRNKVMSSAMQLFPLNHPNLTSITQKFCKPKSKGSMSTIF